MIFRIQNKLLWILSLLLLGLNRQGFCLHKISSGVWVFHTKRTIWRTRVHKQAFKVLGHNWVKKHQMHYYVASLFYILHKEKLKCCYCQCRKSSDLWNMVSVNKSFIDDTLAFNSLHVCGAEGWRTGADKVQSSANISECFYKTCCLQYEVMKSVSLSADCKCFLQIELMLLVSFHWRPTETGFLAFIFLGKKFV